MTAPNIAVFVVDDVAHDLWPPSSPALPAVTPNLNAFAQQSITFPRFYTQPLCSSSRASLLTGRHAEHHGIGKAILAGEDYVFPPAMPTLAQWLAAGGYRTIAAGKWHLDERDDTWSPGFRGFNTWRTMMHRGIYYDTGKYTDDGAPPVLHQGWLPEAFSQWAIDAVDATPASCPFFLWYSFTLAHKPFHDPPPQYHSGTVPGADDRAQFLRMIEAIDALFGQVAGHIMTTRPDTWIFLLGDNGTPAEVSDTPTAAKSTMFKNGINCPLHIRMPQQALGWTDTKLSHVTDLFPTVAGISGLGAHPPVAGTDLFQASLRAQVVSQEFDPHGSHSGAGTRTLDDWGLISSDGYALIRSLADGDQLFRDDDTPVSDPAKLAELATRLDAHIAGL